MHDHWTAIETRRLVDFPTRETTMAGASSQRIREQDSVVKETSVEKMAAGLDSTRRQMQGHLRAKE